MSVLELSFEGGETSLSVRRFSVHEAVSSLFTVSVWARAENPSIDLEGIVGKQASLRIVSGQVFALDGGSRCWTGVVSSIEQVQAVQPGASAKELSTYYLRIVPTLWLLTQRRGYRAFQHISIPDIVDRLLGEWSITPVWKIDRAKYPKLEHRVQYGESDYVFFCRLLEEAGIAFTFPDDEAAGSKLMLNDELAVGALRSGGPLRFVDNPNQAAEKEFVTNVRLLHEVRPGAHVIRDHDFRNAAFALRGEAHKADGPEGKYEQYHYEPGGFLVEGGKGGGTPAADDKGVARHDQAFGNARAERMLRGERLGKRSASFDTNVLDLWPGRLITFDRHPHAELAESAKLLVTELSIEGSPDDAWSMSARALFTDAPYWPPQLTAKPRVEGVQSATVVGPHGQEIHTDEFGRVRVQFPWDREGKSDDHSSCWMRVSQGWAGVGWGMITIPRVGQEVLVGFLGGDPDHPIIVGRVHNNTQRPPYKLPDHKTRSTWKSDSSPGSGGFNEIMFEDLAGKELVYVQAQKNRRALVKNDETITVGNNRQKLVKNNEIETTGVDRMEVTGRNRTEITGKDRTTIVGGDEQKLVNGTEKERTEGDLLLYVGGDQHLIVRRVKRELVVGDSHLHIRGNHSEQVDQTRSLTAGSLQINVGGKHGLHAAEEIHLAAGTALIIEAAEDLTLKGPGGFIRIDAGGITIEGTMVKINSGGSAGSGSGAHPTAPEDAIQAKVAEPEKPVPDDIFKSGLAQ